MSQPISKLWLLGPPFAIAISAFVYYAQFPWARKWVDDRFPWVEVNIGRRLREIPGQATAGPPRVHSTTRMSTPVAEISPVAPEPAPAPAATPAPPSYLAADGRVELEKRAADRTAWPRMVTLKKPRRFPAVVNGKVVGHVEAPVGTELNLVSIQNGQLGVEYRGGGAWMPVEETDLAQRLRK